MKVQYSEQSFSNSGPPRVGEHLKQARKKRGLSLDRVALACGVSKSMLSQVETGKTNPTISLIWKIANGLGCEIGEILSGSSIPASAPARPGPVPSPVISTAYEDFTRLEIDIPGVRFRVLTPLEMADDLEVYIVTFDPYAVLDSSGHLPGTQELLTLLEGKIEVESPGGNIALAGRGFCLYPVDGRHVIRNPGPDPARIHLIVRFRTHSDRKPRASTETRGPGPKV